MGDKDHFMQSDVFQNIVEQCHEGILVIKDGRILFSNPYVSQLSGYTPEELEQSDIGLYVSPRDRETLLKRYEDRLNGKELPRHHQFTGMRKNGEEVRINSSGSLIDYRGEQAVTLFLHAVSPQDERRAEFINTRRQLHAIFRNISAFSRRALTATWNTSTMRLPACCITTLPKNS